MKSGKHKSFPRGTGVDLPRSGADRVHGLFAAIITPFDSEGRVNVDALSDLVRFQISKGTEGIFPCGSSGLGPMLRIDERKTVAETVVKAAGRKVPVVVQVGSADTVSTVELAKHAERVGADAVASLTPYYYKPGDKAVVGHFEAIAKSVSIPVFAYNIPQFTGNNLQASTVASMAKAGTIDGIKDSSRDFLHLLGLLDTVPDEFVVMNGVEEYGLFAIMSGADGLVSGGASALPEVFRSLVAAQRNGDYAAALQAQQTVLKVKNMVRSGPVPAYYTILKERGIDCGIPRAPFLPMEAAEAKRAIKGLRDLGLI
jgi:4-hydroxy-tetrahydrodipicolinate synthase